ncbi:unnamed protein product, partial [Didymodactylos carnosus]
MSVRCMTKIAPAHDLDNETTKEYLQFKAINF